MFNRSIEANKVKTINNEHCFSELLHSSFSFFLLSSHCYFSGIYIIQIWCCTGLQEKFEGARGQMRFHHRGKLRKCKKNTKKRLLSFSFYHSFSIKSWSLVKVNNFFFFFLVGQQKHSRERVEANPSDSWSQLLYTTHWMQIKVCRVACSWRAEAAVINIFIAYSILKVGTNVQHFHMHTHTHIFFSISLSLSVWFVHS